MGKDKCHLAAHSFTGVDARAALNMYGSSQYVESLTTICSPHLGMKLIDLTNDKGWRGDLLNLERVFEILGLTGRSV